MLDEFSIAVDPVTTMRIEDVLKELKSEMTIILVTNLVQQARRLADRTAFFLEGQCVEIGQTEDLFTGNVKHQKTMDYIQNFVVLGIACGFAYLWESAWPFLLLALWLVQSKGDD